MALSPEGTPSVEALGRSDPEPPPEEPWQATCEILLEPDTEQSMDVILVGSSELSAPASPTPCRELLAYEIKVNQRDIEDVCICCGSFQVHTQHPLFEGGMCAPCKDKFLDCLFLYDDDGYQSYCSICCAGETLLICENPDCTRCYCFECVDTLVGPGTSGRVQAMSNWVCFLCLPFPASGLLQRRQKWRGGLKAFCDRESNSLETYKTVPVWKREPVRVLSLFGDIRRELVSLGFLESGSAPGALKHLDDVTDVVRKDVEAWGPFDLVYGATPPVGQACDHPPAWYLFQFHRVLQYARPSPGRRQPFFWMFVDNLVLSQDDRRVATRFLEADPVTIQDVCGQAVRDAVHVWSNIPAVRRFPVRSTARGGFGGTGRGMGGHWCGGLGGTGSGWVSPKEHRALPGRPPCPGQGPGLAGFRSTPQIQGMIKVRNARSHTGPLPGCLHWACPSFSPRAFAVLPQVPGRESALPDTRHLATCASPAAPWSCALPYTPHTCTHSHPPAHTHPHTHTCPHSHARLLTRAHSSTPLRTLTPACSHPLTHTFSLTQAHPRCISGLY